MPDLQQDGLARARRYWRGLAVGALLAAPVVAYLALRWAEAAICINGMPREVNLREVLGAKGLAIIGALVAFPCLGLAGVWSQRKLSSPSRGVLIGLTVLLGVGGTEWLVRHRLVQSNLWVGVLSRQMPSDWAMREPALLLYDNLNPPDPGEAHRGISVFGSSQSAVNFDRDEMASRLGRPVYRRALNGMFALEACAAHYMLGRPRAETAIFYMSPVDLAGNTSVRGNWMRSLISPRSWLDVVRILGPALAWENRRPLAELGVAAFLRLWSVRDGTRWILFNLAGRSPEHPVRRVEDRPSAPPVQSLAIRPEYVEASFRGYKLVMDHLRAWGFDIVVFQGEVNPAFRQQIPHEYWGPMEKRIQRFLQEQGLRYVPLEEYRPGLTARDWADNTHLNDAGRRKLTDAVIPILAHSP